MYTYRHIDLQAYITLSTSYTLEIRLPGLTTVLFMVVTGGNNWENLMGKLTNETNEFHTDVLKYKHHLALKDWEVSQGTSLKGKGEEQKKAVRGSSSPARDEGDRLLSCAIRTGTLACLLGALRRRVFPGPVIDFLVCEVNVRTLLTQEAP